VACGITAGDHAQPRNGDDGRKTAADRPYLTRKMIEMTATDGGQMEETNFYYIYDRGREGARGEGKKGGEGRIRIALTRSWRYKCHTISSWERRFIHSRV
jgi:hypothetical protein